MDGCGRYTNLLWLQSSPLNEVILGHPQCIHFATLEVLTTIPQKYPKVKTWIYVIDFTTTSQSILLLKSTEIPYHVQLLWYLNPINPYYQFYCS